MSCKGCRHWNGTAHSAWGDCGCVLFTVCDLKHEDRYGDPVTPPLDPHDLRYFLSTSGLHRLLNHGHKLLLDDGVRFDVAKEDVMWMDDKGVESVKRMKVPYLQTREDYNCYEFKED